MFFMFGIVNCFQYFLNAASIVLLFEKEKYIYIAAILEITLLLKLQF